MRIAMGSLGILRPGGRPRIRGAISYVGGKTAGRVGSSNVYTFLLSSLAGGVAATPAAGDLVIASYAIGSPADLSAQITAQDPSAVPYTSIGSPVYSDGTSYDVTLQLFYKFMGATPDASMDFGSTVNAAYGAAMTIHVFRGVDPSTPLDVAVVDASGTGTHNPSPGSIAPATEGAVIFAAGGGGAATGAGYTSGDLSGFLTNNGADTYDGTLGAGYKTWDGVTSPVAISPFTGGAGSGASLAWAAKTIALRPGFV